MNNNEASLIQHLSLAGLNPLKAIAASAAELYRLPSQQLNTLKTLLITEAFKFHVSHNPYHRDLCLKAGVDTQRIHNFEDLIHIPLIPINVFKSSDSHKLLSKPLAAIEHEMRSTGTSGIPSVARRCSETLDIAIIATYAMYREFLGICKGAAVYLCPSPEEIPEMGMIKALNMLAGLFDTHRFMVKKQRFIPEAAVTQLLGWENSFTRHLVGPPFLIYRLLDHLKKTQQRIQLDEGSLIITLGGWKRFTGQAIPRSKFNKLCEEYLGVNQSAVRDIYALVEANVLAIEDEYQVKHVSPYAHFTVRRLDDPRQEVPLGEQGLLGILDPLALATPGMILTEDIVMLLPGDSPSQRSGQRMEYITRAPSSIEFGCCAVNLEKNMAEGSGAPRPEE